MPSAGYAVSNTFQNQTGPIPLSQLDANFTQVSTLLNSMASWANYFLDSSGAANIITVTVPAPLTFAYTTGVLLQVQIANTNSATAININVNGLGNKLVLNNDGTAPAIGTFVAGTILELMFDGTRFRCLNSTSGVITPSTGLFGNGSAPTPSISFASDTDTGIYRVGANTLGFATNGVLLAQMSATQLSLIDGSAAVPSYNFTSDPNTGLYSSAADEISFSLGGAQRFVMNTTSLLGINGAAGTPTFGFTTSPTTGMYRDAADSISFACAGVQIMLIRGTIVQIQTGVLRLPDGIVGTPAYTFTNDPDTGLYRDTTNSISFACGGGQVMLVRDTIVQVQAGIPFRVGDNSAATPALTFSGDPDTGFYRDTANQIAIGLAGVTAGQIAQGTFTPTWTGFSANPSFDITWQRFGNMVFLQIAGGTGTSNAVTMTITNIPAAIRPTTGTAQGTCVVVDSGNSSNGRYQITTAGVASFGPAITTVGGFTAAGNKGFNTFSILVYWLN